MKTFTYQDKTITITPLPFNLYMVTDGNIVNYTCNVGMYNAADTDKAQEYFFNILNQ